MRTSISQKISLALPAHYDAAHYESVLRSYPSNEWFLPTNKENEGYTICSELHTRGVISMQRIPKWVCGRFKGISVYFKYTL